MGQLTLLCHALSRAIDEFRYARTQSKHASKHQSSGAVGQRQNARLSPARAVAERLNSPTSPVSALDRNSSVNLGQELDSRDVMADRPSLMLRRATVPTQTRQNPVVKEGSEMLYAKLSELRLPSPGSRNLRGTQALYLGDSWLLTYVIREVADTETVSSSDSPSSLQVPMPFSEDNAPSNTRLDPEDIEILRRKGAFILPNKNVSDELIQTFFEYVFPAFPIFDRAEFSQLYEAKRIPLLILHAVYLIASSMCDESVIQRAGFANRNEARTIFMKRVKALYDANYEANKVVLIQATFLMSFMWDGSMDDKDMWHWLGVAIGLAQRKGMHRS